MDKFSGKNEKPGAFSGKLWLCLTDIRKETMELIQPLIVILMCFGVAVLCVLCFRVIDSSLIGHRFPP